MELWLAQLMLGTIMSAVGGTPELEDREPDVVAAIAAFIDLGERPAPGSLKELNRLLWDLQQQLDVSVNNAAISRTLPVRITVTRGHLIFGIPRIVAANLPSLRDCLFLYLIDEFENLSESQQKYMNTLLRERESPCSFKIGARMYGVRTKSTYSADEDNKEGSEFEVLRLDALLRENDKYSEFAKRLKQSRKSVAAMWEVPAREADIREHFTISRRTCSHSCIGTRLNASAILAWTLLSISPLDCRVTC